MCLGLEKMLLISKLQSEDKFLTLKTQCAAQKVFWVLHACHRLWMSENTDKKDT